MLDKQLPKKKKYVSGNQSPFINKNLSKAIMLRAKQNKLHETAKPLCFSSEEKESIIAI